ncbi:hypothetical protein THAOC_27627 [Thalassiosira oceanica]|uniref:Uncharacterized protein n=1 Tax=Thalassiosira oceanica TaxID=159749 RepID=K0RL48_THAOC|nr:hypothetical protein THAOC_27627 [Thalassiosira oceanica]|eukprot:EJK53009.1 hypothetical protein THAOC_27627 [Thalassiosira oceanica]
MGHGLRPSTFLPPPPKVDISDNNKQNMQRIVKKFKTGQSREEQSAMVDALLEGVRKESADLFLAALATHHLQSSKTAASLFVDGKIRFSETFLRDVMPNHIKRATERTKSMCGCKTCTVFIDMFQNLLLWRTKFVKSLELKLSAMPDGRDKVDFETKFDEYKAHIAKDGSAWSAAQRIACDRLVVEEMDNDKFPHFSCVLNQCSKCPDWSDVIHEFERNSDLPFRFSIFSKHARCLVKEHSDRFIDFEASSDAQKSDQT